MKKLLTPIILLFFLTACEKREYFEPIPLNAELFIDSILVQDGTRSLPKDTNGLYHLTLTVNGVQQFHRVTGRFLINGKEPKPNAKIDWESNMYWILRKGDTVATITQTYVNYFTGQFTVVTLPPLIASKDELVPTVNKASYSGRGGEINTIIAPIKEMTGDTMIIKSHNSEFNKTVYTKIVLE
jgi:hypothetical protein